jgi:hypothetical protein
MHNVILYGIQGNDNNQLHFSTYIYFHTHITLIQPKLVMAKIRKQIVYL